MRRHIEPALQPVVLGRDAARAVSRVAPLRLDTPDRQHRFARHCDHVCADGERSQRFFGKAELSRRDENRPFGDAVLGEAAVDARERVPER